MITIHRRALVCLLALGLLGAAAHADKRPPIMPVRAGSGELRPAAFTVTRLATGLEMTGLLVLMRRRLGGLHGREVWSGLSLTLAGSGLMGLGILLWKTWAQSLSGAWVALGGIMLGGLIYVGMMAALKVREATEMYAALARRLRRL